MLGRNGLYFTAKGNINVVDWWYWWRFDIGDVFSFYASKPTGFRRDLNSAFTIQILSPKIITAISYVAYFYKPWKVKVATEVESPKRIHDSCDQTIFGESVICELDDGETESKMECFEDCGTTMYICNCNRYRYFSIMKITIFAIVVMDQSNLGPFLNCVGAGYWFSEIHF